MSVTHISDRISRVDAVDKASGKVKYVCDYRLKDMNWARMVRSSIPRGTIDEIHLPSLPEGYYFITAKDIPPEGMNAVHMIKDDWRCFASGDVRFVGDLIGLLVGPDRETLSFLIDHIKIDYTEEEPVISIDDAIECKIPPIVGNDNVMCSLQSEKGEDIESVLSSAHEVFEDTITTGFQEHVHLETNSAIVDMEGDKYVIYASAQCPFYVQRAVAPTIGVPVEDIIVRQTTTGGAFGGKENFPDALAGPLVVAERIIKKPISLVFDREEDMLYSVKRHPSKITFRTGLDAEGHILGMDIVIYYNAGPYLSSSFVVLQRGVFHANGVYNIPSTRIKGIGIATNTYPSDAFRGFGAPQALYAIEMHMDHIAEHLGVDPVAMKMQYFLKQGDETVTQGHIIENVVLDQMLDQVATKSDYFRKAATYTRGCGKGIGISFYNHGGAFTGNGEQALIKARVRLVKSGEKVDIQVGSTEMGQGFKTSLSKIVASTLGIDMDSVTYADPDTSVVADSGPTVASRSTMIVGKIAEDCAREMKERWEEGDFIVEKSYEHPEGHPWDQSTFKGDAYLGYGWGCCCVELEVDKNTNEVKVIGIWSSHDIGKAIDELIVQGQINGGIMQSLGYAAMEKMENRKGHFKQASMSDYVIPTSMDFPAQEWGLVDNPYPWGPYGAKGMGELTCDGAAAAYVDALERAIGHTTHTIPLPPEDIQGVIGNEQ